MIPPARPEGTGTLGGGQPSQVPDTISAYPGRFARWAVTLLIVGAMLFPVVRNRDGLPLSTYPMYARTRSAETLLVRALGVAGDGAEIELSIREVADTRDPLVAQSYLNQAVVEGRAQAVCNEIASRLAPPVAAVLMIQERHDVVARARGEDSGLQRTELAACEVP